VGNYLSVLCLSFFLASAHAAPGTSERQEARALALFHQFRCMVCGGQSLAGSDAKIAADMRAIIREKIARGESEEAVTAYLVERYGDAILMTPPVTHSTLPLWLAPGMILLIAGFASWRTLFRARRGRTPPPC
jgi:cytochrome c-type biogenesis protein CcmH